jgi:hypothetical protein
MSQSLKYVCGSDLCTHITTRMHKPREYQEIHILSNTNEVQTNVSVHTHMRAPTYMGRLPATG